MINPYRGVLLNGEFFNFRTNSFKESVPVKNTSEETQGSRTFSVLGKSPERFTLSLVLETNYEVWQGENTLGKTQWLGVSRLSHVKDIIGAKGASMPMTFVTPYGATYNVVPTGAIDIDPFINENQGPSVGMEFVATITLDSQQ